jgi:ATP-dependent helicase YprA (DUF1998 family)
LEYDTCAMWVDLPLSIKKQLEVRQLCPIASVHAANHAVLSVAPLHAQCDSSDLGTEHPLVPATASTVSTAPFRLMVRASP